MVSFDGCGRTALLSPMTEFPLAGLSPASRVTVLAPHPDDEAIGAGGLIQQALARGATVRVVLVTDGDNNPWPQRMAERRWRIDAAGRRRLGVQRRAEAVRSLATLGVRACDTVCLGLPDAALLSLWKKRDPAVLAALVQEFAAAPPDLLVTPSAQDRHPDHRAVFALAEEALRRTGQVPPVLAYLIHRPWLRRWAAVRGVVLRLTPEQKETKLRAILCHETQMKLSRRRFTSFAKSEEVFLSVLPSVGVRA
jgi:LmbE family N-acetylglucosaminyl deacetylase